jgi:hypothetical protein
MMMFVSHNNKKPAILRTDLDNLSTLRGAGRSARLELATFAVAGAIYDDHDVSRKWFLPRRVNGLAKTTRSLHCR